MRRREVLLLLAGATTNWPPYGSAQAAEPVAGHTHLGILNFAEAHYARVGDFLNELRQLGYIDGQNLVISHLWADGHLDRLPALAAELIARKVDIIIALGPSAWAAKRATTTIPIVIAFSGDLVETGMVANLARPGGNITGFSYMSAGLAGKRLELLSEMFARNRRIAVLYNPAEPATVLELRETEAAARTLGVTLHPLATRARDDIEPAFATASRERADGVVVFTHGFVVLNQTRIIEQAARHHMPTMYGWRDFVVEGGLMSYGPDVRILVRQAASYVDRIIKGDSPGNLPVQQAVRLEFLVNLKTAHSLDAAIVPTLVARVDEVVE